MKNTAKDALGLLAVTFGVWFPVIFFSVCALIGGRR